MHMSLLLDIAADPFCALFGSRRGGPAHQRQHRQHDVFLDPADRRMLLEQASALGRSADFSAVKAHPQLRIDASMIARRSERGPVIEKLIEEGELRLNANIEAVADGQLRAARLAFADAALALCVSDLLDEDAVAELYEPWRVVAAGRAYPPSWARR
jgi:hypothetical protein